MTLAIKIVLLLLYYTALVLLEFKRDVVDPYRALLIITIVPSCDTVVLRYRNRAIQKGMMYCHS